MVKHHKKKKRKIAKRFEVMRLVNKEKGLEGRINRLRACILKTAEELSKTRKQKNRLIDEIHVERQVEVIVGRLDSLAVGLDE